MPAVFVGTGLLCLLLSIWTANAIERFSMLGVRRALTDAGFGWATVEADGLKVYVGGTAPTEALRLRALAAAGNVVDAARIRDRIEVEVAKQEKAPDFSLQLLRNSEGISVIGMVPANMDRAAFLAAFEALAPGHVTDMLESADQPPPAGWEGAVGFATEALSELPQSKVSVEVGRVQVTALAASPEDKARIQDDLRRRAPQGLMPTFDISIPHPVITPFTVGFVSTAEGAHFDACSADSDEARTAILAAARAAGAPKDSDCSVGLGVPTPDWSRAVVLAIQQVAKLKSASVAFSDADVTLTVDPKVPQADVDRVVGELESNLPDIFSVKAVVAAATGPAAANAAQFTADLAADGKVDLSGRLGDDLSRRAVESFAAAHFGSSALHSAIRLSDGLPEGWAARVLVGLEALGELSQGEVQVRPDTIIVAGKSGAKDASDQIARLIGGKLGSGTRYELKIQYDKALDPTANLPTGPECVARINAALAARKIAFEPGSAVISPGSGETLDKIAGLMKQCGTYPMEVGGHTDSQGREEMNLTLSQQRAQSVIEALLSRRVLTGNLRARGYGETMPVMANDTEADREQNRRIEFLLLDAKGRPVGGAGQVAPADATPETADSAPPAADAAPEGALPADGSADMTGTDASGPTDAIADGGTDAIPDGADAPPDGTAPDGAAPDFAPPADAIQPKPRPAKLKKP